MCSSDLMAGFGDGRAGLANPARVDRRLGALAVRADAVERASDDAGGRRLADAADPGQHEGVGFMRADNDMALHTARLHIWHTAWLLDQGQKCNFESSRAKVVCSEAQWRVVDRCVQILGGLGITLDELFALVGSSAADGPMFGEAEIEQVLPLRVGDTYDVRGGITGIVRKEGKSGVFDILTFKLELVNEAGEIAGISTNSFVFPRRD